MPGTRADRFHPGCQRPRGSRDLGARHPHSPSAASDRGSLTSTALARLPRFWCARRQKRGENPCPSLSLDLVRVGGMRPHGPQTWGEPKGRHSVTRPCSGGRGVGAQSEGATALPRRVQRRRSAACVLCVSLPNKSCGSTGRGRSHIRRRMLPSSAEEHEVDARDGSVKTDGTREPAKHALHAHTHTRTHHRSQYAAHHPGGRSGRAERTQRCSHACMHAAVATTQEPSRARHCLLICSSSLSVKVSSCSSPSSSM